MQKLQRHDLTFQITRGGEEKSQPQRRLFLSAESAEILSRFYPFHPSVSFIRKIFPPVSPCISASSFLRTLFRGAFTRRIRWCKDGRKGKFRRTCLLLLTLPSEAR